MSARTNPGRRQKFVRSKFRRSTTVEDWTITRIDKDSFGSPDNPVAKETESIGSTMWRTNRKVSYHQKITNTSLIQVVICRCDCNTFYSERFTTRSIQIGTEYCRRINALNTIVHKVKIMYTKRRGCYLGRPISGRAPSAEQQNSRRKLRR